MSKWVELNQIFDWRGTMRHMKSFPVGEHLMTDAQAEEAERRGAGRILPGKPVDAPKTPKAKA